jgi:hypothetical protein
MYSFSFASVSTCVSFAFVWILPSSSFCFRSYSALLTFSDISSAPSLVYKKRTLRPRVSSATWGFEWGFIVFFRVIRWLRWLFVREGGCFSGWIKDGYAFLLELFEEVFFALEFFDGSAEVFLDVSRSTRTPSWLQSNPVIHGSIINFAILINRSQSLKQSNYEFMTR